MAPIAAAVAAIGVIGVSRYRAPAQAKGAAPVWLDLLSLLAAWVAFALFSAPSTSNVAPIRSEATSRTGRAKNDGFNLVASIGCVALRCHLWRGGNSSGTFKAYSDNWCRVP